MPNLADHLTASAHRFPERPALRFGGSVVSYARLDEDSARVSALLRARGLEPGDRVAVSLPNVPEFVILYYGVLRAGCVVVPMNPLLGAREVEHYLTDSGTSLVFAAEDAAHSPAGAGIPRITVGPEDFSERLREHEPLRPVTPVPDDGVAVILYTSGTTGRPKGAALTHASLAHNASVYAETVQRLTPEDVVLGCLPLFHTFGQTCAMNSAIHSGAALTLVPRFEPGAVLDVVAADRVTVFSGVPTMYTTLLHHPEAERADVSSLRLCVSGGSSLPVETLHRFESAFGCVILEGYGLSEASPVVTFNHPDRLRRPGSVGVPIRDVEVRLVDGRGRAVPLGEVGELVVRGPNVMLGYWGRPEETRAAIPDGWLRTGDLAREDEYGYFHIVDRKKDLIIRGGYNVYPREVEEVLYEHPEVVRAAVVGVPHERLGEEVAAAVVLRDNSAVRPEELRGYVRERLAPYKYPRLVWLADTLPTGPTGKVLKRAITPPDAPTAAAPATADSRFATPEEPAMFTFTSTDGLTVHVHAWLPEGPPRATVQIAHGMGEHAARYAPLARALNARGFAVYADDHRGHGRTMLPGRPGALGADGWNLLVGDLVTLSGLIRERHQGAPLVLLGHSLGSFAAQQYVLDHADLVDGVALCGTTAVDRLFEFLAEAGGDVMGVFNAAFQPARTEADWLSRDEAEVDAYIEDPLCGFTLDEESMGGLATAAGERLADPRGIPAELPLYVTVGDRDPLNRGLSLSDLAVERYRNAGQTDITYRSYSGARHELFNETNRDEVVGDLCVWLERVVTGSG